MIRIKLAEMDTHRNETTFRPIGWASPLFEEIGIEFTPYDDFDYAIVSQASIIDKSLPLDEAVEKGLEFLSTIKGDYIILDGQDSTSLMGTIDVFRESDAILFLKNSYLKNFDLYKKGWVNGRIYWGEGDYSVPDIDELKPKMKLSGYNWLHPTLNINLDYEIALPKWKPYDAHTLKEHDREKIYDVSCMFGYPTKEPVYEHGVCQTDYYDLHRKNLLDTLGDKYKIAGLVDGEKIPIQKYYKKMHQSKIIIAPLGYGEMAPRDIEAIQFGSILIKPDMSYISSEPFLYEDGRTYIACKYDWSDLEEKIDYVLSNFENLQYEMIAYTREIYDKEYNLTNLVMHYYDIFKNLGDVIEDTETFRMVPEE